MSISVDIRHKIGKLDLHAQFDIAEPGITALFGPSGSGKTTIINAIAGLLRPDRGRITTDETGSSGLPGSSVGTPIGVCRAITGYTMCVVRDGNLLEKIEKT